MSQVTIYLEEEIENKMAAAAKSAKLSKSKWIARLIQEKVTNEWPQSISDFAGSWEEFPSLDNIRKDLGEDVKREAF